MMTSISKKWGMVALLSLVLFNTILIGTAQAQTALDNTTYVPLAPIKDNTGNPVPTDLPGYIRAMFFIAIGITSILAVVVIIYGGLLYMSTDAYSNKLEGKTIIQRTLWGMLLIAISYLLLTTINPDLTRIPDLLNIKL